MAVIGRITVPTLLFRGDRELGSIVSEGAARAAAEELPSLEIVHLAGATHDIRRAQLTPDIAVVKEFLASTASAA